MTTQNNSSFACVSELGYKLTTTNSIYNYTSKAKIELGFLRMRRRNPTKTIVSNRSFKNAVMDYAVATHLFLHFLLFLFSFAF